MRPFLSTFLKFLFCTFYLKVHDHWKSQGNIRFWMSFCDFSHHGKRAKFGCIFDVRDKIALHIPWRFLKLYIFSTSALSPWGNLYGNNLNFENMSNVMCIWLCKYVSCGMKHFKLLCITWRKRIKSLYCETICWKYFKFSLVSDYNFCWKC